MKKRLIIIASLIIFQIVLLMGCGSLGGWRADAQYGMYKMDADDEYPCVSVNYWKLKDRTIYNWITVYADEYHSLEGENVQKRDDGSYCITGKDYDYYIYFSGNGKIKVEMEKSKNANFASGILKGTYKKAVGTYDIFEAYDMAVNEALEKVAEEYN